MTTTWAVVNQKGGVGKTTTAVNLATSFALAGHETLLIDCDPQGNATSALGLHDKSAITRCIYDVLVDNVPIEEIIISNQAVRGLSLLPSTLNLAGAESMLSERPDRETVLRSALKPIEDRYKYILIDSPPSLGLLILNILTAASSAMIPIQTEYFALEGISQLMVIIDRVRGNLNPTLGLGPVILTMTDDRINLSRQVVAEVRKYFGDAVARTVIPRNVRLSEAPSFGQPIALYDPKSKGALAYAKLAEEIMTIEQ